MTSENNIKQILVVDDDVAVTNYLMVFLMQTEIYEPTIINDPLIVEETLKNHSFSAILLDMDMPGISGTDVLKLLKQKNIKTPVIILSGVNDVELAVGALKLGAFDYLTKPVEDEYLLEVLESAIAHKQTTRSISHLPSKPKKEDLVHKEIFEKFPSKDPQMIRVFHEIEKMALGDLSIFIWGENGSGKEAIAKTIHKVSPRKAKPFIAIDASAIEQAEFAEKFFGKTADWEGKHDYIPGFLEKASEGTLFIDRVNHLSKPIQRRILRVLQKNEYYREGSTEIIVINIRLIVASQVDLRQEEHKDKFSQDLLYHLLINSIHLPSLRDRKVDIPVLAEHFLMIYNERFKKEVKGFDEEFINLLKSYDFPNNVKELKVIIASAVSSTNDKIITLESISEQVKNMILNES
ncbi:MAG: sigma-54 dependent transcriptional regulator [Pseudomonadota bacterium]